MQYVYCMVQLKNDILLFLPNFSGCILWKGFIHLGLWGVINNAGISGRPGPADWQTMEDYRKVLGINTFGLIDVTHTFLPLIKKEKGRIVNTG